NSRQVRNALPEGIPELSHPGRLLLPVGLAESRSLAHANNLVSWQGAGAQSALVAATVNLGRKLALNGTAHVQGTNTLRSVKLVGRKAEQIHIESVNSHVHPAHGLGCVHVEAHVRFPTHGAYFRH